MEKSEDSGTVKEEGKLPLPDPDPEDLDQESGEQTLKGIERHHSRIRWSGFLVGSLAMIASFGLSVYTLVCADVNFDTGMNVLLAVSTILSFTVITVFVLAGAFGKSGKGKDVEETSWKLAEIYPLLNMILRIANRKD